MMHLDNKDGNWSYSSPAFVKCEEHKDCMIFYKAIAEQVMKERA